MKQNKQESARRVITGLCALTLLVALVYSALPLIRQTDTARTITQVNENLDEGERVDAMAKFIGDRAEVRNLEILQLNSVAADEDAHQSVRAEARRQLIALTARMEQEVTLEGVLRLRGYEDAVVTVHADSVNVIVRADALTQSDSAIILELVMRETGITGGNVKIMCATQ